MGRYTIRPSVKELGKVGLYEIVGENRTKEVFTGTHAECSVERSRLEALSDIADLENNFSMKYRR